MNFEFILINNTFITSYDIACLCSLKKKTHLLSDIKTCLNLLLNLE